MGLGEELTNIQKVAIEGEVAYAVSTAGHDADIKYRIYCILKEVEEEFKPFLIQAFKEATTFNESVVDKIYFETLNNNVPVWLWAEKVIADIKEAIRLMDMSLGSRLSIDKREAKKRIAESSFINFAKKALLISTEAAEYLFNEILNDIELSFIHTSCFYLRSCCEEIRDTGTVQDKVPEDLMECQFDIRDMLSFRTVTEAFSILDMKPKRKSYKTKKRKEKVIKTESIDITPDMTEEEISELISQRIMKTFKGLSSVETPETAHFKYVVNKVFNNTQISTTIRVCETMKEAEEFIAKIEREYPELQQTCKFFISKEKDNGNR